MTMIASLCVGLGACTPQPIWKTLEPGETGRVVRIIDGDALVLNTGQSVRLVSIEAPARKYRDRPAAPHADRSARLLEDLALGQTVQLYYPGTTRDRYDRALAHVIVIDRAGQDIWLNRDMVQAGAAWARLYSDTDALGEEIFTAEKEARRNKRGLWTLPDYRTSLIGEIPADTRGFRHTVLRLGTEMPSPRPNEKRRPAACWRRIEGSSFALKVEQAAEEVCQVSANGLFQLRGWISNGVVSLSHPRHIEPITD